MRFCGVTMIKLNVFYTTLILLFSPPTKFPDFGPCNGAEI